MRTTIRLDSDVVAAAERLRRERGIGLGEAINELARAGMHNQSATQRRPFRQRTRDLGARVDLSRNSEVLDLIDEPYPGRA
ncbi:ribbon-helix-helix protein, CopG family [Nocardia cyriacigeorgica]|uniref:Ribbon-helix-helix protein, CopG family n=1 Tax=Nocardia cyriacigeorgica TaxID=135487 RepID=A0A5R8NDL9_9NOCA|nr:ribbon-helix-helix protein, CopG family [Nocardia cyriacigeorgica]TLF73613.1 ribbon-helix-helix protein, CopG family [Nocardia cyriacigeorgica]